MELDGTNYLMGSLGPMLFGVAVLASVHVLPNTQPRAGYDPTRLLLNVVGWVLLAVGLLAVCFVAVGFVVGVAALVVAAMAFHRYRRGQQYAMLSSLTVAVERGIPLIPILEAFAIEGGGEMGRRARHAAGLIRSGWTLPDALEATPGLVPYESLSTIRVGHLSGNLAHALRSALETREPNSETEGLWHQTTVKILYLLFLIMWLMGLGAYLSLRILPEFQKILEDFGMDMPPATQALVNFSEVFAQFLYLPAGGLFLLANLFFWFTILRYIGVIRWDPPGVDWLLRRLDAAAILDSLALTVERDRSLKATVASLALSYPKAFIRSRLRKVIIDLFNGVNWCDSLLRRGLIGKPDAAVLNSAQRVGNLPWALREMADSNRRRMTYRLQSVLQVLYPMVIAGFGIVVMLVVIAYFMPLIALIVNCAKWT